MFGAWSNIPFPAGEEFLVPLTDSKANYYLNDATVNNIIIVGVDTGDENVIAMEVAVADTSNYNLWKLATTINKFDQNGNRLIGDFLTLEYKFYNTTSDLILDNNDFYRLFDFVPQVSAFETTIENNRIIDIDYIEGFDNGLTDNKYSLVPQSVDDLPVIENFQAVKGIEPSSHTPDAVYVDLSGIPLVVGTVVECTLYRFTWLTHAPQTIPGPWPTTDGSELFKVSIVVSPTDTRASIVVKLGQQINARIASNFSYFDGGIHIPTQEMYFYQSVHGTVSPTTLACHYDTILQYYPDISSSDHYYIQQMYIDWTPSIVKKNNFKSGATHFFGLEYADDDMRIMSVQKNDTDNIFIPFLADYYGANQKPDAMHLPMNQFKINWQVFGQPLLGAKYWRFGF